LSVEDIERLVFDVVKVIRGSMSRRGRMVHHGKGAPSGFRRGLDDTKTIEEPKRWSLSFDYAPWYKRGEQGNSF